MTTAEIKLKPFLRGHFHQAAFFFALGACTMLLAMAQGTRVVAATLVYGLSISALFGVSSLYHRITWKDRARSWFRRLDHASIFIFIAGTATPICLLGLQGEKGQQLLVLFWGAALLGVGSEVFWSTAPKWVSAALYVIMGWLAGPYVSDFFAVLGDLNTWLLIVGGIIYTLGAVIYALKWPNPSPRVFGYHEIFHLIVMAASVFHFVVVYRLVWAASTSGLL